MHTKGPLISIIIPTFNRSQLLGSTLDSVVQQSYKNWECIIVDDDSNDYTVELSQFYCERDKRFRLISRPSHSPKGANSCRNFGFSLSKGQYINWFDDDDVMLPNFLQDKLSLFHSDVKFVICSFFRTDEFLKNARPVELVQCQSLFKSYVLYELKIITHSILFKKSFLSGEKLFLPGLERGQEVEFYSRLFRNVQDFEYAILNKPLFLYRQHKLTKSYNNRRYIEAFKFSLSYIAIQNLQYGIILKDREIIIFYYKQLISIFFRSLEVRQTKNARYILNNLIDLSQKISLKLYLELYVFGNIFLIFKKGWYRYEKRLKNYLN